ncbi:MAG TPA: hypothetical protein ENI92_03585, partial [Bacteroidetes bacterium]|nr:hypothetical protein [Bacteroidota bacterium]
MDEGRNRASGKRVRVTPGIAAIALLILLFGTGCSRGGAGDGTVRLTYWAATNPYELELAKRLTAERNDHRG